MRERETGTEREIRTIYFVVEPQGASCRVLSKVDRCRFVHPGTGARGDFLDEESGKVELLGFEAGSHLGRRICYTVHERNVRHVVAGGLLAFDGEAEVTEGRTQLPNEGTEVSVRGTRHHALEVLHGLGLSHNAAFHQILEELVPACVCMWAVSGGCVDWGGVCAILCEIGGRVESRGGGIARLFTCPCPPIYCLAQHRLQLLPQLPPRCHFLFASCSHAHSPLSASPLRA